MEPARECSDKALMRIDRAEAFDNREPAFSGWAMHIWRRLRPARSRAASPGKVSRWENQQDVLQQVLSLAAAKHDLESVIVWLRTTTTDNPTNAVRS